MATPERKIPGRVLPVLFGLVLAVLLAVVVGYGESSAPPPGAPKAGAGASRILHWTCSMHPQIIRNGPGQCPIGRMKLEVPSAETL